MLRETFIAMRAPPGAEEESASSVKVYLERPGDVVADDQMIVIKLLPREARFLLEELGDLPSRKNPKAFSLYRELEGVFHLARVNGKPLT